MDKTIKTNKNWRFSKWLAILIIPFIIIVIHFSFYFSIKSLVNADKSVNPQATEYFVQANTISTVWINTIHDYLFIDYDSPIMKPLLDITDYYFNKGEKLLSPNNAEDAVWWFLTYAYIYNINFSSRKDNSMDIYKLPKDKEMDLRYKLADYIIKIGNYGVKGVEFGEYESSAMHAFFATHFSEIDYNKHYRGKSEGARIYAFWHDDKLYHKRIATYKAYIKFVDHDKFLEGWRLYSLNNILGRVIYFVKRDIELVNGRYTIDCNNRYIGEFFEKLQNMVSALRSKYSDSIPNRIAKETFKNMRGDLVILDALENSCAKYKKKVREMRILLNEIKGD